MSPVAGQRLGPYEILALIGAGGMGEVWRARDTRLDRSVALKMIPAERGANPRMRARFEREARSISQLSHPNICALYDVGDDYLVMELLEGESLADRLMRGRLPLDQALRIGIEVSSALQCAHRSGIVHRDLKPGNVMLTKSGAKLLDFGLAKALMPESVPLVTADATEQQPLTEEGTIVGTYFYMSPEQLTGGAVDHRSDIFALGALLYEMVTGRRAFEGKTKSSVIASILDRDPAPLTSVNAEAPAPLERIVASCLAKDPDVRWQSAHDVALELKSIRDAAPSEVRAPLTSGKREVRVFAIAAIVALAVVAGFLLARRNVSAQAAIHAGIIPPAGRVITDLVVSPRGDMVAMIAGGSLWLKNLGDGSPRLVEHSEDCRFPFWSPDGRSVAFFAGNSLFKAGVSGGPPVLIQSDLPFIFGGSWGADDTILLAFDGEDGVRRISAAGGGLTQVTTVDRARREGRHMWPSFLPDGRHFLFLTDADAVADHIIYVASTDPREPRKPLLRGLLSNASYADGFLLFTKSRTLMAQPFDADRLTVTGPARPIHENIAETDFFHYVFSGAPSVLCFSTFDPRSRLHLIDRSGRDLATFGEPADWVSIAWSPDGRRAIVERVDAERQHPKLWMADLSRPSFEEIPVNHDGMLGAQWSADSSKILYFAGGGTEERGTVGADAAIYVRNSDGSGEHAVVPMKTGAFPSSWIGDWVAMEIDNAKNDSPDVIALSLSTGKQAPVAIGPLWENGGSLSPDGRWIAYAQLFGHDSTDGRIIVKPFPPTGAQFTVSSVPGVNPEWRNDGRELFYGGAHGIYAVPIEPKNSSIDYGESKLLIATTLKSYKNRPNYAVSRGGERFLLNIQDSYDQPAHLILGWTSISRQ